MNQVKDSTIADVLIVGGGVIGASLAARLSSEGARVQMIDQGQFGGGCSYMNAGWMTPCFALPLPQPGLLWKSIKWMLNPESPLYIQPHLDPMLIRWLLHFASKMNRSHLLKCTESLVQLSLISSVATEKLAEETSNAIQYHQKGLLMVAQSEGGLQAAIDEMDLVREFKISGKRLTASEVRLLEPEIRGEIEGGVYFPNEAHVEPYRYVQVLCERAQKNGAQLFPFTEVYDIETKDGKISEVVTTRGVFRAHKIVFALGAASLKWQKKLNMRLPILGGKGYALNIPFVNQGRIPQPKIPMLLVEKKIAVTPRQNSLKLAGTLELVKDDFSINRRRVNAILKGSREFMEVPQNVTLEEVWRGLRPCTPDGVPMIGSTQRWKNLYLSCGHQMLGLQTAMGTAEVLAQEILGKPLSMDIKLFSPDRF